MVDSAAASSGPSTTAPPPGPAASVRPPPYPTRTERPLWIRGVIVLSVLFAMMFLLMWGASLNGR